MKAKNPKTLEFIKGQVMSLDHSEDFGVEVIVANGNAYTLTSFTELVGHDDSLPYQAELRINGCPLGICFNDGWGGMTEITAKSPILVKRLNDELEECKWGSMGMEMSLTLDFIADILAQTASLKKHGYIK